MWYRKEEKPGVWIGLGPLLTNKLDKAPEITVRDKSLEFIARHYAHPTLYPLGSTSPQYSNAGYVTLGWIIQRLSGQPFDQFMKFNLFDKLGMKDTFFFPAKASAAQRQRIADLDRRLPDPPDYNHYDRLRPGWVYPAPEGGLYSTATDLHSFLSLLRHHGQLPGHPRILQPGSVKLLVEDQVPSADCGCNGRIGRSLGFYVIRPPGCPWAPALSPGTINHSGRFSTDFWYNAEKDEIVVILNQRVTNLSSPLPDGAKDAFEWMLERITTS
jgi:CubicO group peptidase (beta-lactamase class C family)